MVYDSILRIIKQILVLINCPQMKFDTEPGSYEPDGLPALLELQCNSEGMYLSAESTFDVPLVIKDKKLFALQSQCLYMFRMICRMFISVKTTEHLNSPVTFLQRVDCCHLDITPFRLITTEEILRLAGP